LSPQSEPEPMYTLTSVPLFSGTLYHGIILGGSGWGIILRILSYFTSINFDILQWCLTTFLVVALIQFFFYGWKRRRFRNPVKNPELFSLFEKVKNDLGKGQGIDLWYREIDRSIFLSTVNPLFKAILFSESAIADILDNGEKGKVLLAREVLMIERVSAYSRMILGLLGVTLVAFFESISFGGTLGYIVFSIGPIIMVLTIIGLLLILVSIPYRISRREQDINKLVEDLYGFDPDAARLEVLVGVTIPDEVLEEVKRDEAEGKPSVMRKMVRKGGVAAIISFVIVFVIMFIFLSDSVFFLTFALSISAITAFGAFGIVLMIGPVWSIIKPGSTRNTDYDIQIPFAADVQGFLSKFPDLDRIIIRGVKPLSDDMYGLVVLRLDKNYEEKTLYGLLPNILKDIHDIQLVGPLILSEIKRDEIEKRYNRINHGVVGISILFLFISMFLSITLIGLTGFFFIFLQILFIYLIMAFIPSFYMYYWKRKSEIRSDTEIAISCPRFRETLQILIDKHHTLPYGKTSYRTRLERVNKYLDYPHDDKDNDLRYGID